MSFCCYHCRAVEDQFDEAAAKKDLRRYRRKGPDKTTAVLLEAIGARDIASSELLDVGGGIGVIVHELLATSVASATLVEASSAYLAQAKAESERRGQRDRVRFFYGDVAELAHELPQADLVTLDRVVCCYPDYERLLRASAGRCRRWYALSLPRARWYIRAVVALQNALRHLRGSSFRTFVHPTDAVHGLLVAAGLERSFHHESFVWQVSLYSRTIGSVAETLTRT